MIIWLTSGGGLVAILTTLQQLSKNFKLKKEVKQLKDNEQDKVLKKILENLKCNNEKINDVYDYITKDKKRAKFPLEITKFYLEFLNNNNFDEKIKRSYQKSISLVTELYDNITRTDIDLVTPELFELSILTKIRTLYNYYLEENNIDKKEKHVVLAKKIVYQEIKYVCDEFKRIKIQYTNGDLLENFGKIMYKFTVRSINKLTNII